TSSSKLGLPLSSDAVEELSELVSTTQLCKVSPALAARELKSMLAETIYPSIGIELLRSIGALNYDIPELYQLYQQDQRDDGPWIRTLKRVDRVANKVQPIEGIATGRKLALVLAALFYELAKKEKGDIFDYL